jgi:hypothetical protein
MLCCVMRSIRPSLLSHGLPLPEMISPLICTYKNKWNDMKIATMLSFKWIKNKQKGGGGSGVHIYTCLEFTWSVHPVIVKKRNPTIRVAY